MVVSDFRTLECIYVNNWSFYGWSWYCRGCAAVVVGVVIWVEDFNLAIGVVVVVVKVVVEIKFKYVCRLDFNWTGSVSV